MEKTSPFPRKPRCRLGGDSVTTKKMAKRRERRVAPCSDGPKKRGESSNREQFGDSATDRRLITIFVIFFIVIPVVSVFLYYVKFSPRSSRGVYHVHQRGLIKTDVSYQEILTENSEVSENVSYCHYKYPVLAYITPWNSKGYEMAKKFNSKFTHLSPFWYDLKRKMEYDGIVLESWSRWAVHGILHDPDMRNMALEFMKQLGHALHSVNSVANSEHHLQLVYFVGPPETDKLQVHDFGPADL